MEQLEYPEDFDPDPPEDFDADPPDPPVLCVIM